MLEERLYSVGGHRLNVAVGPDTGPTLLMLHGVTRRWQSFVPLLPALTLRFRVFAADFAGHGKSDRNAEGYMVRHYIRDAQELLERHVTGPVYLYGHSLGGMVAAYLATKYPERIQAAVLEDPPFETMGARINTTSLISFFRGMQPLAAHGGSVAEIAAGLAELNLRNPDDGTISRLGDLRDAASLRFTASCLHRLDPDVLLPIINGTWLEGYDRKTVLSQIFCPTLLLQADVKHGGMLTDKDAEEAEQLCPLLMRSRFAGVGHLLHWWNTPTILSHAVAFLESAR